MICIFETARTIVLAATAFTLSWNHSVERIRWQEDWTLTPRGLELVEARIQGSGAGMEPPEGARLADGWWFYHPDLAPREELILAASGATGSGWRICAGGKCHGFGAVPGEPVRVAACPANSPTMPESGG